MFRYKLLVFFVSSFIVPGICYSASKIQVLDNLHKQCGTPNVVAMIDELKSFIDSDVTASNNMKVKSLISEIQNWLDKDRVGLEIKDCCDRNTVSGTFQNARCAEQLQVAEKLDDYCSDKSNPKCKDTYNDLISMLKTIYANGSYSIDSNISKSSVSLQGYIREYLSSCKGEYSDWLNENKGEFKFVENYVSGISSNDQVRLKKHLTVFFASASTTQLLSENKIKENAEYHCCYEGSENSFCPPPVKNMTVNQ